MAGPVLSLFLRNKLTGVQISELDVWIKTIGVEDVKTPENHRGPISEALMDGEVYSLDFQITNAALLGVPFTGTSCLFLLNVVDPEIYLDLSLEEHEKKLFRTHSGYIPQQAIGISAMCNKQEDHLLLASLAVNLAEKFGDAMISLFSAPYVQELPGVVLEASQGPYKYLFVDATYLKAWMSHATFRLIK